MAYRRTRSKGIPHVPDPTEMGRLIDLMPASGRMWCKLVSQPSQPTVIDTDFPLPWNRDRQIMINFDLWEQLPQPQRDLLLLRTISWVTRIQWFKVDVYQGLVAAGVVGTLVELVQADVVGIAAAGGLTALAGWQIWRKNRSSQTELEADENALKIAQRRGYGETDAARHLYEAIESVARIEDRSSLSLTELLRCQNLKAIAGLSPINVPESVRARE